MSLSLTFYGAARTVTGSCILVQAGSTTLLIDCGLAQGNKHHTQDSNHTFPFDPSEIDALICTHGHLDHTGRVPELVQHGFKGKIYGHYATCEIAGIIWKDIVSHSSTFDAAFTRDSVTTAKTHCMPIAYSVPMSVNDVEFTLYDSGHILGSSQVVLSYNGKKILFSGDVGPVNTPIIRDPFCTWEHDIDAVVIESTYGSRIHKQRSGTIDEFRDIVKDIIKNRGGLLIPAFAIGRTQEILFHLNTLVENKYIPRVPVFLDSPMADRVTDIYCKHRDCYDEETIELIRNGDYPLDFPGLTITDTVEKSNTIHRMRPPFIVVAGSGMCTGGRILKHLERFISLQSTTVMFTGWQAADSLGRQIVNGAHRVNIDGKSYTVKAQIKTLNGFSAHADRNGLLAWADTIPGNSKKWFVNHGEEEQACSLANALGKQHGAESCAVRAGVRYVV